MEKIVSIGWHNLSIGQLLFVQAVVMPEIVAVVSKYMKEIIEIGECEE